MSLQVVSSSVKSGSRYLTGDLQEALMPCVNPSTMRLAHSLLLWLPVVAETACHPSVLWLGLWGSKPWTHCQDHSYKTLQLESLHRLVLTWLSADGSQGKTLVATAVFESAPWWSHNSTAISPVLMGRTFLFKCFTDIPFDYRMLSFHNLPVLILMFINNSSFSTNLKCHFNQELNIDEICFIYSVSLIFFLSGVMSWKRLPKKSALSEP